MSPRAHLTLTVLACDVAEETGLASDVTAIAGQLTQATGQLPSRHARACLHMANLAGLAATAWDEIGPAHRGTFLGRIRHLATQIILDTEQVPA